MKPTILPKIDPMAFRTWMESMQEASKRIHQEKCAQLSQLTPSESLAIYLDLWQTGRAHFDFQKPSEYLIRLQTIYQRILEATRLMFGSSI